MSTSRKAPKAPKATPAAVFGAVLVSLTLIALGAVGLHWLAVELGWASGPSLPERLLSAVDGSTISGWGPIAAIPMIIIGLWLLLVALKPRRRTHEPVSGDTDTWLTPQALGALANSAAQDVPGVLESETTLKRRTVKVRVVTEPDVRPETVTGAVRQSVSARLAELTDRTVEVRPTKGRS